MKKIILTMVMGMVVMAGFAQEKQEKQEREDNRLGWNVSIQGGVLCSINENTHAASFGDLLTPGMAIGVGYDFTHSFGIRGQFGYGRNVSGTNVKESGRQLTLYKFNDVSLFGDAIFNLSHMCSRDFRKNFAFELKGYVGLGCVFADDYDAMKQGFYQGMVKDNGQTVLGMRFGFIGDWHVSQALSIYGDFGLTGYTDGFNGVNTGTWMDMRLSLMMGVTYHF